MSIYYLPLEWPTLTHQMHLDLVEYAKSAPNIRPTNRRNIDNYHHYPVPDYIEEWCRANLDITPEHRIILQRFFNTRNVPPHIDGNRVETCNYVLSESGPITRWFNNNQVVDTVVFPQHKWYKLKVDAMHDVINIKTERLALSIHVAF